MEVEKVFFFTGNYIVMIIQQIYFIKIFVSIIISINII